MKFSEDYKISSYFKDIPVTRDSMEYYLQENGGYIIRTVKETYLVAENTDINSIQEISVDEAINTNECRKCKHLVINRSNMVSIEHYIKGEYLR